MSGITLILFVLLITQPLIEGLSQEKHKHCCDLGVSYATNKFSCKTFLPEMAGVELANERLCLTVIDVCCKKKHREMQCEEGIKIAKNNAACPDDEDKKECCEACQAGREAGNNNEPCTGFGVDERYDEMYTNCCKYVEQTSTSSNNNTTSTTATPEVGYHPLISNPSGPVNDLSLPRSPGESNAITANENICDSDVCAQICEPLGNSYRCDCFKGYALMEDKISCRPVKRKKGTRCESENPCDHDCTDTGTAIKCTCREGYKLADDNRTCLDVDECATNQHDCATPEDCINEVGGYSCYEPAFGAGNESVDFDGKCPVGYKFDFDKLVCDDIDECKFDLMCVPPKVCKNTIGSFTCEGDDIPKCPSGFHFKVSTQACEDVDECLTGNNDCNKDSQVCLNTKGNYTCVDKASRIMCPPGFKKNPVTQNCDDINECEDSDACEDGETCLNEPGGHTCIPTKNKVTLTNYTQTTSTTPKYAVTTYPTYVPPRPISCPPGYMYSQEANVCSDINECQTGNHKCQQIERCDNTVGSYHCTRIYGCGTGYTLNAYNGLCEDDDECELGTNNCNALGSEYVCRNLLGSYRCEHIGQTAHRTTSPVYKFTNITDTTIFMSQTPSSFPIYSTTVSSNPTQSQSQSPLYSQFPKYPSPSQYIPPYQPQSRYTPSDTSTESATSPTVLSRPFSRPPSSTDSLPSRSPVPPNRHTYPSPYPPYQWSPQPHFVPNSDFRSPIPTPRPYYSVTPRVSSQHPFLISRPLPPYQSPHSPSFPRAGINRPYQPEVPEINNVIPQNVNNFPVISGQLKKCLPGYKMNIKGECEDIDECESNPCIGYQRCLNFNGRYECTIPMQCKIGFELNDAGDQCVDVNECSRGTHKCNPTQICKNYQGYYTCECPAGHHFNNRSQKCEDMDECRFFRPCGSYAECINTKGSFRCDCKDGFRKINNLCDDIDECKERSGLCEHNCINTWGSHRCSCKAGFTLNNDNRTCNDIDECERFKDRRLCIGTCRNIPGSYGCECPNGYKLGADGRVCIDIDECQQNVCNPGEVCLNTRGSYKCYRIECPKNYVKDTEHKSRCKRLKSVCDARDYTCSFPEQYTYQYITLVSKLPLPGHVQLFQIKGPHWPDTRAEFSMKLLNVNCPSGIQKADESYFQRISDQLNSMALFLVKSIEGPQEIKLQIQMKMFQGNTMFGNVIVYIVIVVSEYTF